MYTSTNYKTKKALREAFDAGEIIRTFQPGGFFEAKKFGSVSIEGPHYPKPHSWYATGEIVDGVLLKLDGKPPKNQEGVRAYFAQNLKSAADRLAEATK